MEHFLPLLMQKVIVPLACIGLAFFICLVFFVGVVILHELKSTVRPYTNRNSAADSDPLPEQLEGK
jgi:hypothetical protein